MIFYEGLLEDMRGIEIDCDGSEVDALSARNADHGCPGSLFYWLPFSDTSDGSDPFCNSFRPTCSKEK